MLADQVLDAEYLQEHDLPYKTKSRKDSEIGLIYCFGSG
jgi:hypothetical protein